jgi:hypothetical protein
MGTTTIEDQLAELRRRIERLRALAPASEAEERARIRRHLGVLEKGEASVRDAIRNAAGDEVEERLGQLTTRLHVAEHSRAADLSRDWPAYAAAVEAELRGWDDYLERLQTGVAARAWKAREQSEAAIGAVRSRRIELEQQLALARDATADAKEDARERLTAERDKLEQTADELSAKLT